MKSSLKRGFTLIELLVVIAIIAILAAILFPVFSKAREKARQTQCTSNQRQIAIAVSLYAQEHDETLPDLATIWMDLKLGSALHDNNIAALQNAGTPKVVRCPDSSTHPNGYVYNSTLSGVGLGNSSVGDPTSKFLLADGWHTGNGVLNNVAFSQQDLDFRHSGKLLSAYLDGHIGMQGPDFVNTCGLPATATFFPNVPASAGMGPQDFMIDTGSVTWTVTGTPADGATIISQGGYKCTIDFTKGGNYTVTAGSGGASKAIEIRDYKIQLGSGAGPYTYPIPSTDFLPDTPFNFTYTNLGSPVTGNKWEYRITSPSAGTFVDVPGNQTGATATITFTGVLNIAQVFEVRATNNASTIASTCTVNVAAKQQAPGDPNGAGGHLASTYLGLTYVSASVPEDTGGTTGYKWANDHEETNDQVHTAYIGTTSGASNALIYSFGGASVNVTGLRLVLCFSGAPSVANPVIYSVANSASGPWTEIARDSVAYGGASTKVLTVSPATGTHFKLETPSGWGNDDRNYRVTEIAVYGTGALWIEQPQQLTTASTPPVTVNAANSNPLCLANPDGYNLTTGLNTWLTGNHAGFKGAKNSAIVLDLGKSYTITRTSAGVGGTYTDFTVCLADAPTGPWNAAITGHGAKTSMPGQGRYLQYKVTGGNNGDNYNAFYIWGTPVP